MPPLEPNTASDPGYALIPDAETLPVARRAAGPARQPLWVRGLLLVMAAGFTTVLGIAVWIDPYHADGSAKTMATHTQLGLPQCNMVALTGKPCPACGMTTSFALLAHGDPLASARANWCGTLLAAYWAALIPWGVVGAVRGRLPFVRSGEMLLTVSVGVLLVLMLGRWAAILLT